LIGLAIAIVAGSIAHRAQDNIPATWKVGLAKAIITPETTVWLAGYGTKRPPDGRLHDLWMKAMALQDQQGNRAVLVTSDFQGIPKSMSDLVFEAIRQRYGLDRAQIMITLSHNHCGPRLGDDLQDYYPFEAETLSRPPSPARLVEYRKPIVEH
jgi:hypothetical protein